MLKMVVENDIQDGIKFWEILNHEMRCQFVSQLSVDNLRSISKSMNDLEEQCNFLLFIGDDLR